MTGTGKILENLTTISDLKYPPKNGQEIFRKWRNKMERECNTKEAGTKVLVSIIFGLSRVQRRLENFYYADFISFYSPTNCVWR